MAVMVTGSSVYCQLKPGVCLDLRGHQEQEGSAKGRSDPDDFNQDWAERNGWVNEFMLITAGSEDCWECGFIILLVFFQVLNFCSPLKSVQVLKMFTNQTQ